MENEEIVKIKLPILDTLGLIMSNHSYDNVDARSVITYEDLVYFKYLLIYNLKENCKEQMENVDLGLIGTFYDKKEKEDSYLKCSFGTLIKWQTLCPHEENDTQTIETIKKLYLENSHKKALVGVAGMQMYNEILWRQVYNLVHTDNYYEIAQRQNAKIISELKDVKAGKVKTSPTLQEMIDSRFKKSKEDEIALALEQAVTDNQIDELLEFFIDQSSFEDCDDDLYNSEMYKYWTDGSITLADNKKVRLREDAKNIYMQAMKNVVSAISPVNIKPKIIEESLKDALDKFEQAKIIESNNEMIKTFKELKENKTLNK